MTVEWGSVGLSPRCAMVPEMIGKSWCCGMVFAARFVEYEGRLVLRCVQEATAHRASRAVVRYLLCWGSVVPGC